MERIAVIGGGIAGLVAAHMLKTRYDVRLFEKSNRLGGNAFTVTDRDKIKHDIAVGVFIRSGYPHFFRLLDHFDVKTKVIPGLHLTFKNLTNNDATYLTSSWQSLKAQNFQILKPEKFFPLFGLSRKVQSAFTYFRSAPDSTTTFRDFCIDVLHLDSFPYEILLNILCLLTSMLPSQIEGAPAHFFFRKIEKYDIVSLSSFRSLRVIRGRTQRYISELSKPLRNCIALGTEVCAVDRSDGLVRITTADGSEHEFDKVVFACNADQALRLLNSPTADESRLLGAWRYNNGEVVLHSDNAFLPNGALRGLFNFTYSTNSHGMTDSSVSGYVSPTLFATQHPNFPIKEECVLLRTRLRTPIFDNRSIPTIAELPSLNGHLNSFYCGSHFGFGLHEDAIASASEVCKQLGVDFDDIFGPKTHREAESYG